MTPSGLHSRLSVSVCENCPLASLSMDAPIRDLQMARSGGPIQFLVDLPAGDCQEDCTRACERSSIEMVTLDDQAVGRIRDPTCESEAAAGDCDCGCLLAGLTTLPVDPWRIDVQGGIVHMEFTLQDRTELRTIVTQFRENGLDVSLDSLANAGMESETGAVTVALSELTPRQREVVATAVAMGYYDDDGATASEVAATLGIAKPTLSEHLSAATKTVFGQLFSGSTTTIEANPVGGIGGRGVDDEDEQTPRKRLQSTHAD
ncbi:MAG: helix-turn-helix domain-containing protein [Natronomonas sp.]